MAAPKPLTDLSLLCVMEYLEPNRRFALAAHCPSLRIFHQSAPLFIRYLKLEETKIVLNDYQHEFEENPEKSKLQEVKKAPAYKSDIKTSKFMGLMEEPEKMNSRSVPYDKNKSANGAGRELLATPFDDNRKEPRRRIPVKSGYVWAGPKLRTERLARSPDRKRDASPGKQGESSKKLRAQSPKVDLEEDEEDEDDMLEFKLHADGEPSSLKFMELNSFDSDTEEDPPVLSPQEGAHVLHRKTPDPYSIKFSMPRLSRLGNASSRDYVFYRDGHTVPEAISRHLGTILNRKTSIKHLEVYGVFPTLPPTMKFKVEDVTASARAFEQIFGGLNPERGFNFLTLKMDNAHTHLLDNEVLQRFQKLRLTCDPSTNLGANVKNLRIPDVYIKNFQASAAAFTDIVKSWIDNNREIKSKLTMEIFVLFERAWVALFLENVKTRLVESNYVVREDTTNRTTFRMNNVTSELAIYAKDPNGKWVLGMEVVEIAI